MKGNTPTLHCDAETGCDEWTVDYYEVTASNVDGVRITSHRRAPGWTSADDQDLCPKHARTDEVTSS